jgi:hypothetical protein
MQMTMCKLFLHKLTKYWYFSFDEPVDFMLFIYSIIFAFSYAGNKFGISPLFKILHTSSTMLYRRICVSENKNIVWRCYNPAIFIIFCTSSTHTFEFTSLY